VIAIGSSRGDGLADLRLDHPLTVGHVPDVARLVEAHVARGVLWLRLDVAGVPTIDACGVAALLRARAVLEAAGGALFLRLGPRVEHALKTARVMPAFHLLDRSSW
jgi:anti-anti-sigma regulatory factor